MNGDKLITTLADRMKDHRGEIDAEQLANFAGVTPATAYGWFGKTKPLGGVLSIKIWHFLAACGISSPELDEVEKVNPYGYYIGRLLAFGVISVRDACEICKKDGGLRKNGVFRHARGESKSEPEEPALTLTELKELYGASLQEAEGKLRAQLGNKHEAQPTPAEIVRPPKPSSMRPHPALLPRVPAQPAAPAAPAAVTRPEHDQLERILRENRSQLTAALQEVMAQLRPTLESKALSDSSTEVDETEEDEEGEEVPEELTVEMLRFLNEAADKVRQASMIVKILLEHTSPEVRALFREIVDARELRLLINRLSKVSNEHANNFRGIDESGE